MAARDFTAYRAPLGGHSIVRSARENASETFLVGELVFVNNDGELATFPKDGSEALVADMDSGGIGGVACEGANNTTAALARTIPFIPFNDGTLFRVREFVTNAAVRVNKTGDLVGESFQLEWETVGGTAQWCVVSDAGVFGTDICAKVHAVVNDNGQRVLATDTLTAPAGFLIVELIGVPS